jgi:hypothetical protein
MKATYLVRVCCLLSATTVLCAQDKNPRETKVRADREKVERDGFWIYNDLAKGFAEAKRTGKPLLVVLRCIPCEECVKLDDEMVDRDPVIGPLLEKYVCVRQVSTNGLDLNTFQYDTDQSFVVFILNADGTVYGRFGTRSHRTEWLEDVSLEGMAEALQGGLELHANYPANRDELVGKRGKPLEFSSPEKYPELKEKYSDQLAMSGEIVKSCIHCHQIGDARRSYYRSSGNAISDEILFPYPHPKLVGLILDPKHRAKVERVVEGSWGAAAGFQPGDEIHRLSGQPILSMADVQWVLDSIDPRGGTVLCEVRRNSQALNLTLRVPENWRQASDISWRVSTWGLRRMATGGMVLENAADDRKNELGIAKDKMSLRVKSVGQWGLHATAKKAGFEVDDVIVKFGDRDDLKNETELLRYAVQGLRADQNVLVVIRRRTETQTLTLPMQN